MSSSISNSRKIYLKIVLAIILGIGAVVVTYRLFLMANNANAESIIGRVVEARAALPRIMDEDKELMMVFGSSMVQAGFSPRVFDQLATADGKKIKSFNFGFGGLNPLFQDYLSRRIKDEFQSKQRKLKLAVIEFNPFQTTQTRWNGAKFIVDSYITMLASNQELFDIALDDPTRGIRLFNIKYLRNDISAETVTSFYGRMLFPGGRPERVEIPEDNREQVSEIGNQLTEAFKREYPNYVESNWSYDWQGGGTIPSERSAETLALFKQYYALLQDDSRMQNARLNRIFSADIEEMNFEPLLVESFINIVNNFKQIAEQVEIVMLPRNTKWINYSEEGVQRLQKVINEIESATGLKVVSHQEIEEITPEMFGDSTHLARYLGDVPYTQYLYQEYKSRL